MTIAEATARRVRLHTTPHRGTTGIVRPDGSGGFNVEVLDRRSVRLGNPILATLESDDRRPTSFPATVTFDATYPAP